LDPIGRNSPYLRKRERKEGREEGRKKKKDVREKGRQRKKNTK
jgi:hypothetical protein